MHDELKPAWRKQRIQRIYTICAVGLFGVLAHLAFLAVLPSRWRVNQSTDYYRFYEPVARNVLAGNGLVAPDGTPALEFAPGFMFLLAGAFEAAEALNVSDNVALRVETRAAG